MALRSGLPTDVDHLYARLFWIRTSPLPGGRVQVRILNEHEVLLEAWEVDDMGEAARRLRAAGYWHPFADTSWLIQDEHFRNPRR